MDCETAKSQVFPYVDGELDTASRAQLERHFAECRSCRRVVTLEEAFQRAYVARLRPDPAPRHVRERVARLASEFHAHHGPAAGSWVKRRTVVVLVAAVLVAVGAGLGMTVTRAVQQQRTLAQLADATVVQHERLSTGVLPPDVAGASPREVAAWLRSRLNFTVVLPDLAHGGVRLLGARISYLLDAEAAALQYTIDDEHVSLFVIPGAAYRRLRLHDDPKFKVLQRHGYDVIVWRHHETGYAVVSGIGAQSCLVCHTADDRLNLSTRTRARL